MLLLAPAQRAGIDALRYARNGLMAECMVLLPLLALAICFDLFRRARFNNRGALIASFVVNGVFVAVSTETLSAFHCFTRWGVVLAWLVFVCGAFTLRVSIRSKLLVQGCSQGSRATPFIRWCVAAIAIIGVLTFVGGYCSAPTNWDSMTYHLTRVMHWIQDRSVADYPTNCLRQLYQPPLAEFAIAQLNLLWGSDRLVFLPQWLSLIVSLAAISAIAQELGADARGQIISAVIAATTPVLLLQAVSTQNNLVLTAWLCSLVYFLLRLANARNNATVAILLAGASGGLALLTKGTAYALGIPFAVLGAILLFRRGLRRNAASAAVAVLIAIAINGPHLLRYYLAMGDPLVPRVEWAEYRPEAMSPSLFASNVLRNLSLHAATPIKGLNVLLLDGLEHVHHAMHLSLNDPHITAPAQHFRLKWHKPDEDLSGCPLQLVLIGIAFIWILCTRQRWPERGRCLGFIATIIVSGLIFCSTLKWQQFNARLHTPLFCLAAAPVAIALARQKYRGVVNVVLAILFAAALPYIVGNTGHPFFGRRNIFRVPREKQYFVNRVDLYQPYRQLTTALASQSPTTVLLAAQSNDWEYPFWVMLRSRIHHMPKIMDVPSPVLAAKDRAMPAPGNVSAVVVLKANLLSSDKLRPYRDWAATRYGKLTLLNRPSHGIPQSRD